MFVSKSARSAGRLQQFAVVAAFLVALLGARAANAFDPEWQWKVVGRSAPTFPTQGQAAAYARSLTSVDPRYALLTVARKVETLSDSQEIYRYEAPKKPPIPSPWRYYLEWASGQYVFDSESELIAYYEGHPLSPPQCPTDTFTPSSEWAPKTWGYGHMSQVEHRNFTRRYYQYWRAEPPATPARCEPRNQQYLAVRARATPCEQGYYGETARPGCYLPFSAQIEGRPMYCEASGEETGGRGNPCNAVTGDKSESVVDYQGPYGLRLVRHYHSRSLDDTRGWLGTGWSHNYQAGLARVSGNTPSGLIRPSGYRESFQEVDLNAGIWMSKASGVVLRRLSNALWNAYLSDGTVESYDTYGKLASIRDSAGRVTTLTYDQDLLTDVAGPFGHALHFEYDASEHLVRVRLGTTSVVEYTYAGNNLTGVTYPDGTRRTYHYEDGAMPGYLTGITDESGARFATFAYDSSGRAIRTEHAGGAERYDFTYNPSSTVVTDALGTPETISFTTTAFLSRRINSVSKGGNVRRFVVPESATDRLRRVTQETDARGAITTYVYDLYHLSSKTEAFGTPLSRTTTYAYLNNNSDLPTLITEPNRTTAYAYDANGSWLTKTVTDTTSSPNVSRVWARTYDTYGRVLTERGPRTGVDDVTTYSYYTCTTGYECGQLKTVTNALNHATIYGSYNAHGQPLNVTDANGVITMLAYDERERLRSRQVGAETTTFAYWPTGLLKSAALADGSSLQYTYDNAHRLTQVADGLGNRVVYTLDPMGNRTVESAFDANGALARTRSQVFNGLSQLWKLVGATGTAAGSSTFSYDDNGNQIAVSAPLARHTGRQFDELNRLKQITDPGSGVSRFGYDANDNLTFITDPRNLTTTFAYNGFGELKQQVSPDTGASTNTYDSAGNLATRTDARGKTGTYSYDALNRVTSVAYPDLITKFIYDAGANGVGRLTGASDARHTLSFTYDPQGRLTGKSQKVGGVTKSVRYIYTNGSVTGLVTPSGQTLTYSYSNGRIVSVTLNGSIRLLDRVLYVPFGPVAGWSWGNGTPATRLYDIDGNLRTIESAGSYAYGYDDAFRVTSLVDRASSSRSWTYGYDLMDRLSTASRTGQSIRYGYDANGNRLNQAGAQSAAYTLSPTSNRLSAIGGAPTRTYAHDASGNVVSYSSLTYAYSDAGRMSSVTNGGVTTAYVLNALGQRVRKSNGSATRDFFYDEAGHLLGEYDGSGALIQETVWLYDIPVATLRPNGATVNVYYVHTDHLNTPRRISRPADNAVVWRWDSDPFGNGAPNENPDGDASPFVYNLRFPGQYFDAESGIHYNYFRNYDPAVGRYVESDPIGLAGGVNTYGYALQNPALFSDSLGLETLQCTRRLKNMPFRFGRLYHQFVCVGDSTNGYTCGGLGPTGNVFGSPGVVGAEEYRENRCESVRGKDDCVETCIKGRFTSLRPPNYSVDLSHGDNCQTYADGLLADCVAQCAGRKAPPGVRPHR